MGRINMSRVILGGIVTGVIINLVEGVMNGVMLCRSKQRRQRRLGALARFQ